ncbi:MAG: hypothetical protein KKH88_02060 [Nanoarchaeota archaeon]|nr:hypothetical protein [Nanoarchaeota archaeon]
MRDNYFLQKRLVQIWTEFFPDVPKLNEVSIIFKGKAKWKFGHIESQGKNTRIVLNRLFRSQIVPQYIIDLTIAHELVHYAHGFHSPHPRKYKYPHQGGIVKKELNKRGFKELQKLEHKWFKTEWTHLYDVLR